MTEPPLISICILAGHGAARLDACLASLSRQAQAPPFEVLIGGNPTPAARAMIGRHFPGAPVCETGRRHPGGARNPLVERARGELVLFLDDDVVAPPGLLRSLAEVAARHPQVSVFGGPNSTPPDSSRFEAVQGAVLSSLVGSGPVARRYGARHGGPADERWFTLCNLAVRRRAMVPFADELVCAEENELLDRLRRRGGAMLYDPALSVFHARRSTRLSFAAQMLKYGRGRGQVLARRPGSIRLAYLAPAALIAYLLVALPLLLALGAPWAVALAPPALYVLLAGATAGRIAWTLRAPSVGPLALSLILTVHLCYGAGVIWGVLARRQRARRGPPAPVRWSEVALAEISVEVGE
jgi:succinoglycan biosynthesis protein ExoA